MSAVEQFRARSAVANIEPSGAADLLWTRCGLVLNDKRLPLNTLLNATNALKNHPDTAGRFWYDEFLQRVMSTWSPDGEVEAREWKDADDLHLSIWMQDKVGISRMASNTVRDAVTAVAYSCKRNECREWMDSLVWDGEPRLLKLMERGFGAVASADDRGYYAAVGKCWLVSMVARVNDPGCKVDTMPVFEGEQGIRKGTALEALVGKRWYAEASESPTSKDFYQVLTGKLLVEIAEMDAFSRAEVNTIKRVITCKVDRYRAPYGRRAEDHPRMSVFAGTTNKDDWNRDETGARRFWPVACTNALDIEKIKAHRDQLFAEAVHLYRAGVPWWDVPADRALEEQDDRREVDVWADPLERYLASRDRVTMAQVLEDGLGIEVARQTQADQKRAGKVMRSLGWKRGTRRDGKETFKGWCRMRDRSQPIL